MRFLNESVFLDPELSEAHLRLRLGREDGEMVELWVVVAGAFASEGVAGVSGVSVGEPGPRRAFS